MGLMTVTRLPLAEFQSDNPEANYHFYHHYDTVPADTPALTNDPFTRRSTTVSCMVGVDDDKGHYCAFDSGAGITESTVRCQSISWREQRSRLRQTWINIWPSIRNILRGAGDLLVWEQRTRNNLGQLEIFGGNMYCHL